MVLGKLCEILLKSTMFSVPASGSFSQGRRLAQETDFDTKPSPASLSLEIAVNI